MPSEQDWPTERGPIGTCTAGGRDVAVWAREVEPLQPRWADDGKLLVSARADTSFRQLWYRVQSPPWPAHARPVDAPWLGGAGCSVEDGDWWVTVRVGTGVRPGRSSCAEWEGGAQDVWLTRAD